MRKTLLPVVVLLACAGALAATAAKTRAADGKALLQNGITSTTGTTATAAPVRTTAAAAAAKRVAAVRWLGTQIAQYQQLTWKWQHLMGRPLTETEGRSLGEMSVPDVQRAVQLWQRRAQAARLAAAHPPHLGAWLCIHGYEASWTDSGAPYFGGLQMDYGFMSRYGGRLLRAKGPASNWSPLEQMWVAERAYSAGRGFYPWPNTARYCGLI